MCFRAYYGASCKIATLFTKLWLPESKKASIDAENKSPTKEKILKVSRRHLNPDLPHKQKYILLPA